MKSAFDSGCTGSRMSPSSVSRAESMTRSVAGSPDAVDVGFARENALVAEHVAVVRILQLVADVIDGVAVAGRAVGQAADVDVVADRRDQAVVARVRDVGRTLDLVRRQHGRALT